jgi:hypothetical protein
VSPGRVGTCHPVHRWARYCSGGVAAPCPAGRFGSETQLTSMACTGPCRGGYFCAPGSVSATQAPCWVDAAYYCAEVRACALWACGASIGVPRQASYACTFSRTVHCWRECVLVSLGAWTNGLSLVVFFLVAEIRASVSGHVRVCFMCAGGTHSGTSHHRLLLPAWRHSRLSVPSQRGPLLYRHLLPAGCFQPLPPWRVWQCTGAFHTCM